MTGVSYVPGRDNPDSTPESGTETSGRFFSQFPASTPKFAINAGPRRSEFVETMARLTIDVGRRNMQSLLRTLPADVQAAARTLLFDGSLTAEDSYASGVGYFDFLLTSITDPKTEREQAVDTLSDNTVIFYSGQTAPVLSGQGVFINTFQDDQHVWFQLLYAELLRGSALARRGLITRFAYDSFFMSGYLTSLQTSLQGGIKNGVDFSFTFRVKQIQIATPILYNPSPTTSRVQSALFQSTQDNGANDDARRGVQTTPGAVAERGGPITVSIYDLANIDARELLRQRSAPPRVVQAAVDADIVAQSQAATAALAAAPNGGPSNQNPVAASGDVRAQMAPKDSAMLLSYKAPAAVPPSLTESLAEQLRAGATGGTTLVSPVTGDKQQSSAYADLIGRQAPTEVTLDTRAGSATGVQTASGGTGVYQDIYRVHDTALSSVAAAQGTLTLPPLRPRTRRRPRGLSTP